MKGHHQANFVVGVVGVVVVGGVVVGVPIERGGQKVAF